MRASLLSGICLGAATGVAWGIIALLRVADWAGIKRAFYTLLITAIFFYTACAIRAVAKYFQAKTDKLKGDL